MRRETIAGLRESVAKDREAVRLLDCAASYVERGWVQRTDAATGNGVKVPAHSRRARCWCMVGAMRAAVVRIGLARLVDLGDVCLQMRHTAFSAAVLDRALYAAAKVILGRDPKHPTSSVTIVTQWNDSTATSGAAVAQRLREAAALIRARIADVSEVVS